MAANAAAPFELHQFLDAKALCMMYYWLFPQYINLQIHIPPTSTEIPVGSYIQITFI